MPRGDRESLKADPEDGYTPIANLLLEAIAIAKLTGREKGILLLLCRKIYGWQLNGKRLKQTSLSIRSCAKALEIDQRTAQKLLASLAQKKIVSREFSEPGYGYTYSINTRVGEWANGCVNREQLVTLTRSVVITNTRLGQNTKAGDGQNTNTPAFDSRIPKESIKENIKQKEIGRERITVMVSGEEKQVSAAQLWQMVLGDLKQQVTDANYRTWLEQSVGLGTRDGVFVVGVPPAGSAEYLTQYHRSRVERILTQHIHKVMTIEFVAGQSDEYDGKLG
jgi:phage replication O-like protein O